ncbi:MAG: hypothetical protein AAGE37_10715 [Pseudomonadota bacterium]
MTIILAIADSKYPIHLVSDILLSARGDHDIKVPLPHLMDAEKTTTGSHTIAGLAQKTIVLGRTSALFAGDVETAYKILKKFFYRTNGGEDYVALNELVNSMSLTENERSSVAIMTFYCKDKEHNLTTCGYNIQKAYDVGPNAEFGKIQTVGSGSDDFVLSYVAERNEGVDVEYRLYEDIIHRVIIRTIEPFLGNTETFEELYGAWFEASIFMGDTFEKMPIAIKFWFKESGDDSYNEYGPLIHSQYVQDDLFISTVRSNSHESQCNIIRVRDFFGRSSEIDSWSLQQLCDALEFNPRIFVQVLLEKAGSELVVRVCPYFIIDGDPLVSIQRTVNADGTIAAKVTIDQQLKALVNSRTGEADLTVNSPRRQR